jgi:hypothetical protein
MSTARHQPPTNPVKRNVALLSASLAANSAMLQLAAAVAAISLARVLGVGGLLGLGPAIVLATGALASVPAGRAMDRLGRVPVLAAGFGLGAAGCAVGALGSARDSARAIIAGVALVGFNDLLSGATGACLTLLGGIALTAGGVPALALGAMAIAVIPAVWILHHGVSRRSPSDFDASNRHASTSSPLARVRPEHAAALAGDDPRS